MSGHPSLAPLYKKTAYTMAGFERFCEGLVLKDGESLRLEEFQKRMLRDHFRGVIEELVIIPKKNGKTTLFAAMSLYHLLTWPKADVVVVAASAEQAGILFEQAADMVESSGLEETLDVRGRFGGAYRQIRLRDDPSARLRVLAADAKTADGVLPTLALVDELHRHRTGELYGVLRSGIDARDGRMVTISTAGLEDNSILWRLRDSAHRFESYYRKGPYCYGRSDDGSFVLHEWSLRDEDDRDDLALVKKANPLSSQTIEKLRRRRESPSYKPGEWARLHCGVWTGAEEPWLEAGVWDNLKVDIGRVKEGEPVWVAVSAGANPAIVLAAPRDGEAAAVRSFIWEGDVSLAVLENWLLGLTETFDLREVAFDRVEFQRSAELLEARGLPMVEIPHSPERLSIVSQTLHRLISQGDLAHDGDAVLRAQVTAAVTKETERGWRLLKSPQSRALIAMAVAVHQATQVQKPSRPPRIYTLEEVS
jgi:phage terminase large subunit-like protein